MTAFVSVDFLSGAPYSLSPEYLKVALTLAGSRSRLEVTEVSEARLRNVKWLRIRAADLQDRD